MPDDQRASHDMPAGRRRDVQAALPPPPDRATLGYATLFALFLAGVLLLLVVLPAEFGIDPTNFGRITGISDLAQDGDAHAGGTHHAADTGPRNDTVTLVLGPGEDLEYKFHLAAGAMLVYEWNATGSLAYDLHGEPDAPSEPGEFQSHDVGAAASASGGLQAPFSGRHGWYFRNDGAQPVEVTLRTWGHYEVVGLV